MFTAAQAIGEGWTTRQVERRLEHGRWHRLAGDGLIAGPFVAAVADGPGPHPTLALPVLGHISAAQLGWAAALTYPDAVVGGRVAALLLGLPVTPDRVLDVFGRPGRRGSGRGAVRIRTLTPAVPDDQVLRRGSLAVTDQRRTALDCLARLPWHESLDLYAWLLTHRRLTHDDLCDAVRDRFGRPGTAQLRRLASVTRHGALSAAEQRMHRVLRGAGISGWRANAEVGDDHGVIGVVDILFEDAKLVIEVDGERAHRGREAFLRDRRRQNRLVNAGYRVLRFTWWDLVERPDAVLDEIRAALGCSPS